MNLGDWDSKEVTNTANNAEQEYYNKAHDDYLSERAGLISGELESARNFDKYLVALSSGAFGLSVAFIKDVIPTPTCKWTICGSWCAFGASLIFVLIALLMSQSAFQKQQEILTRRYERCLRARFRRSKLEADEPNPYTTATSIFTKLSAAAFIVGVIALALFGILNLK